MALSLVTLRLGMVRACGVEGWSVVVGAVHRVLECIYGYIGML
jgi:hypothetical protein